MLTLKEVVKNRIGELEEEYQDLWKSAGVCNQNEDREGFEKNKKWMEETLEKKRELEELLDVSKK